MDNAIINGHTNIAIWLHENRSEGCTISTIDWAITDQNAEILKYLYINKNRHYRNIMVNTPRFKKSEYLKSIISVF